MLFRMNFRRFLSLFIYEKLVEDLPDIEVAVEEAIEHKSKMNLNTLVQVNDVHPRALTELTHEVAEMLVRVASFSLKTVLVPEA